MSSDLSVKEDFDNKILGRKEVKVSVENEGATMSRLDVKSKIAKYFKYDENLVIVSKIVSDFGEGDFTVTAHLYDDLETLDKIEKSYIKTRNNPPVAEEGGEE